MVASVLLSALAQIVLKAGMMWPDVAQALAGAAPVIAALTVATQPLVLAGLSLYGLGMVIWLFVLSRIDVSLGIVVTMALGHLVFGEIITIARAAGTALIVADILMLATS